MLDRRQIVRDAYRGGPLRGQVGQRSGQISSSSDEAKTWGE